MLVGLGVDGWRGSYASFSGNYGAAEAAPLQNKVKSNRAGCPRSRAFRDLRFHGVSSLGFSAKWRRAPPKIEYETELFHSVPDDAWFPSTANCRSLPFGFAQGRDDNPFQVASGVICRDPQGLKPASFLALGGTLRLRSGQALEAVPFPFVEGKHFSGA